MIRLFSVEGLRTGWAVWWRAWVPFILVVTALLLTAFLLSLGGFDFRKLPFLFAALVPILAGLGVNIALIFWLDRASKKIALSRYNVSIHRFVGWTMFWRTWLMAVALGVPTVVLLSILGVILTRQGMSAEASELALFLLELVGIVLRFLFLILACGWAFGRVLKVSRVVNPAS